MLKIYFEDGGPKMLSSLMPKEYLKIDCSRFGEDTLQVIVFHFFSVFIKPLRPSAELVCNPYAGMKMEFAKAKKARQMGLRTYQPDMIFCGMKNKGLLLLELKNKERFTMTDHERGQLMFMKALEHSVKTTNVFANGIKPALVELCKYYELDHVKL